MHRSAKFAAVMNTKDADEADAVRCGTLVCCRGDIDIDFSTHITTKAAHLQACWGLHLKSAEHASCDDSIINDNECLVHANASFHSLLPSPGTSKG